MRKKITAGVYWGLNVPINNIVNDINTLKGSASKQADLKIAIISEKDIIPLDDIYHFYLDVSVSNENLIVNRLLNHIGDWDMSFLLFQNKKLIDDFDIVLWDLVKQANVNQTNFKICDKNGNLTKYNYYNSIPFTGRTHFEKYKAYLPEIVNTFSEALDRQDPPLIQYEDYIIY
jgi:hypothetical protein